MSNYVIKVDNGSPVGNPTTVSNFKTVNFVDTAENEVTNTVLRKYGYRYFNNYERPVPTKPWKEVIAGDHSYSSEEDVVSAVWVEQNKDTDTLTSELASYKLYLKTEVSKTRFLKEVSGITVGDEEVSTIRQHVPVFFNTYVALKENLIANTAFKSTDGNWSTKNLAEYEVIVTSIDEHIRKCILAEKSVSESIDALTTFSDIESFDIETSFNTAYTAA